MFAVPKIFTVFFLSYGLFHFHCCCFLKVMFSPFLEVSATEDFSQAPASHPVWAEGYMEQGSKRLSVQLPGAGSPIPLTELTDGSAGDGAIGMCINSELRPGLYRGVPISD